MKKPANLKSASMLTAAAFIWGSAFVAQRAGMDYISPFTFLWARSALAGVVLLCFVLVSALIKRTPLRELFNRQTVIGGLCCGGALFFASATQQIGLTTTSAGKAGFLTTVYIIIVPVLGLFIGKKPHNIIWLCVLIAVAGLYLLSVKDGLRIDSGDLWVILCAFCFSFHILVVDHFSGKVNAGAMSCIQFFFVGLIALPCMLTFEQPQAAHILDAWFPLFYTGVMSSGIAFTLQISAQNELPPAVASIIMSLESVFAVLCGWLILGEQLLPKEAIGCVLMFAAVILAQVPLPERRRENG